MLVIAGLVLIIACTALALGWKTVAEDARAEVAKCEGRQKKRVADIPRIVVGIDIKYRGDALIPVSELRNISSAAKIDPLYKRLVHDRRTTCDAAHVCLDNLVVLELVASIDDITTNMIVRTAWAAGYDIIKAPPRNDTW